MDSLTLRGLFCRMVDSSSSGVTKLIPFQHCTFAASHQGWRSVELIKGTRKYTLTIENTPGAFRIYNNSGERFNIEEADFNFLRDKFDSMSLTNSTPLTFDEVLFALR